MAETKRDLYEVLGVARTATPDELKHAYRLKVRDCHPDTHPNDPEAERKYKEVNEAYSVLSDSEKRQRYDQFGTADDAPGMGGNPFGGSGDIFDDVMSSFFGSGFRGSSRRRPDAPQRGNDLQMVLSITLEEAATGCKKTLSIPRWEPCDHCHGTGSEPGHDPKTCPTCGGTGEIRQRVQTLFGYAQNISVCPTCGGRGKVVEKACGECGGEGRLHRRREQSVEIQPGIENGMRLRVSGGGDVGLNGGSPGDLYILIEVRDNPDFERDGADLHRAVTIPFPLAVMGGKAKVASLIDGEVDYDIPEGTRPGDTIRVRGVGMPRMRGSGRGDLCLHVTLDVPKGSQLSERGAQLINELADEMQIDVSDKPSGILGGLFGGKKQQAAKRKPRTKKK